MRVCCISVCFLLASCRSLAGYSTAEDGGQPADFFSLELEQLDLSRAEGAVAKPDGPTTATIVFETAKQAPDYFAPTLLKAGLPLHWDLAGESAFAKSVAHRFAGQGKKTVTVSFFDDPATVSELSLYGGGMTAVPAGLGRLTGLKWLVLGRNAMAGPIPANWGELRALTHLLASQAQLKGSIPPSFDQLKQLVVLDLSTNGLSGQLPAIFDGLSQLTILRLDSNGLSGPIPRMSALGRLRELNLSHNALTGYTAGAFADLLEIEAIELWQNRLTTQAMDAIIADLWQDRALHRRSAKSLRLRGSAAKNGIPSKESVERLRKLKSDFGWTISCDSCGL